MDSNIYPVWNGHKIIGYYKWISSRNRILRRQLGEVTYAALYYNDKDKSYCFAKLTTIFGRICLDISREPDITKRRIREFLKRHKEWEWALI